MYLICALSQFFSCLCTKIVLFSKHKISANARCYSHVHQLHAPALMFVTRVSEWNLYRAVATLNVSGVDVRMYGVGGQTVQKLWDHDLHQVAKLKPDILVLEIGANDLNELPPEVISSAIQEVVCLFVCLLHKIYGVNVIMVSASIHRQVQSDMRLMVTLIYWISISELC